MKFEIALTLVPNIALELQNCDKMEGDGEKEIIFFYHPLRI